MRKVTAFVTALAIFISVLSSATFAQASSPSGEFIISDFSEDGICAKWSGENMSEATITVNSYDHKTALLKSEEDGSVKYSIFKLEGTSIPTDWSNVEYLNLWIYSPKASDTATLDVIVNTYDEDADKGSYMRYAVKTDFVGWKLISIAKEKLAKRDEYATWENVTSMTITPEGWGAVFVEGTKVYFKKIWTTEEALGEAQVVSRSIEDGAQNVVSGQNILSFELDETIDEKLSTGTTTVKVFSIDGTSELLSTDKFAVSYNGKTVSLSFAEGLKAKKEYEVNIENIYTVSGKKFSLQTTFSTFGYKQMYTEPTLFTISDFSKSGAASRWSGTNMSEYGNELGGYSGTTAKLETFYDATKPAADQYKPYESYFTLANNSLPTDWTDIDAVNMWVYSPEKKDAEKYCILLITNNSYFQYPITLDFEGWKLVSIKKSEFIARDGNALWNSISKVGFVTGGWSAVTEPGTKLYFKDIWVTKASNEKLIQTSIKNNELDVCINETTLEIVYDTYIYDVPYSTSATLYKYDGKAYTQVEKLSATIDKGTITIVGQNPYEKNTKYKIEIENLYLRNGSSVSKTVEFTTSGEDVQAKRPVISEDVSSDNVTVQTTVYNSLQSNINAGMTVRLLNKEGELVAEKTSSPTEIAAGTGKNISVTIPNVYTLLKNFSGTEVDTYTIEAFVVNKTDGNKPILRHIGIYPDNAASYTDTSFEQGEVNLTSSIQDKTLVISGAVSKGGIRPIVITITNEKQVEKLLIHTYTNSDGSYSLNCNVDSVISESGWYNVKVAGYQAMSGTNGTDTFYFADDNLKESICKEINDAQTTEKTATIVDTYQAALGLQSDDYTNAQKYSNMITTLLEQKQYQQDGKYQSFGDIVSMLSWSESILSQLNDKKWTDIAAFVTDNKQIIMADASFDNSFFAKTAAAKNAICEKVAAYKPFDTFSDFRSALTNSINAYNKEQKELSVNTAKPSNNGGGGGGGGGGGSNMTFPVSSPASPNDEGNTAFSDLDDFAWADREIHMLLEKGVISKSPDNKFRPGDAVKREEFVKMIVEAFGISLVDEASGFSDSAAGMWYEKYLSSAKNIGIVFGKENGSFGVGEMITREDMAVMMLRAVKSQGLAPENQEESFLFADEDEISSYALAAVEEMQQSGFIKGMGDGRFSPKGETTRAQAAVIISRVMVAFEKGAVNQ